MIALDSVAFATAAMKSQLANVIIIEAENAGSTGRYSQALPSIENAQDLIDGPLFLVCADRADLERKFQDLDENFDDCCSNVSATITGVTHGALFKTIQR